MKALTFTLAAVVALNVYWNLDQENRMWRESFEQAKNAGRLCTRHNLLVRKLSLKDSGLACTTDDMIMRWPDD